MEERKRKIAAKKILGSPQYKRILRAHSSRRTITWRNQFLPLGNEEEKKKKEEKKAEG